MDGLLAIIESLEMPAAIADALGLVGANAAFAAAVADKAILIALKPGEHLEAPAADGGSVAWRVSELPDNRRLIQGHRQAEAPSQRDHYLASLSHELRTPLNGVLGMADLLADTRLAADQRSYLSALREC